MDPAQINRIIYKATNSSDALRGLYDLAKGVNRRRSLAYYCKRAGIPSTGYFSDVLSGKRTLNPKYRTAIARAFDLSGEAAACLRLLVDIDNESDPSRLEVLHSKLVLNKKTLRIEYLPIRADTQKLFAALDVFCAFGLFGGRPTRSNLERYFHVTEDSITEALQLLESLGLIRLDGDRYVVVHDHVLFGEDKGSLSHVDFLKMAIAHAAENVASWFEHKDQAYFTSTIASVKKERYADVLQDIKAKMLLAQSSLGSDNADMLVRFNVQIYPVSHEQGRVR